MSGITVVSSLPLISHTFRNVDNIEFLSKLMLTIPSIVIALFAPFAGYLVDKFGRLKPLYVGIILFIIGGSSGLYLDNFYYILIGRAILGLGVAFIMTSSTTLIGDYFNEEQRHKFMSKQGMVVGVGGIVFITSGGLLAQIHWSYPFAIYLIPILFLPIIIKYLYEPTKTIKTDELELNPSLFPIYITAFFVMVLFYMLPTQLPYLIINTLNGEPQSIGFVIATSFIFNIIMAMQYSKIKSKFSYMQIYSITFLFFSIGVFIISQASNISDLYYATVFLGTAFGLLLVNTNAWFLSSVSKNNRGKASGILTASFFFGQFSSPLIFQPIVNNFGIDGLFLIVSIITIIVSFILFIKFGNKQ